jgi:hypothetical protein
MIERSEEISPATKGLTITEGKAPLVSLQKQIVTAQVQQPVAFVHQSAIAELRTPLPRSDWNPNDSDQ